jgi:hypothetical protein
VHVGAGLILRSALRAEIYKEPLRGTLNRPPPAAPAAQPPLLAKEGTGVCSPFPNQLNTSQEASPFPKHFQGALALFQFSSTLLGFVVF